MTPNDEIRHSVFKFEDYFYKKYEKQIETTAIQRYYREMNLIENCFYEWGEVFNNEKHS